VEAASLVATKLVDEPIAPNLIIGLVAVFAGIWIATTTRVHERSFYVAAIVPMGGAALLELPSQS
jgi:hypothetical protein